MLRNAPIVPYIPVADVGRACKFYEGLKPKEGYAGGVIYESGKGSWVFMYPSAGACTSKASCAFWQVDDVEAEVGELKNRGWCSRSTTCQGSGQKTAPRPEVARKLPVSKIARAIF